MSHSRLDHTYRSDRVYLTELIEVARWYATRVDTPSGRQTIRSGAVFEVEPLGRVEIDPAYWCYAERYPSYICASARILRVLERYTPGGRLLESS